jgi:hypothetical protein
MGAKLLRVLLRINPWRGRGRERSRELWIRDGPFVVLDEKERMLSRLLAVPSLAEAIILYHLLDAGLLNGVNGIKRARE